MKPSAAASAWAAGPEASLAARPLQRKSPFSRKHARSLRQCQTGKAGPAQSTALRMGRFLRASVQQPQEPAAVARVQMSLR